MWAELGMPNPAPTFSGLRDSIATHAVKTSDTLEGRKIAGQMCHDLTTNQKFYQKVPNPDEITEIRELMLSKMVGELTIVENEEAAMDEEQDEEEEEEEKDDEEDLRDEEEEDEGDSDWGMKEDKKQDGGKEKASGKGKRKSKRVVDSSDEELGSPKRKNWGRIRPLRKRKRSLRER
ncbi:glutamic acid-rich protein-like [Engraulis encrasicolus]|uniref:glutamic acid-rich protein-like n=1 Tax=Engraulis encrasicolus TaxID=184585 RepID=UPI002FD0670E